VKPLFWSRPPDRPGDKSEPWPDLAVRDGDLKLLAMQNGSRAQLYDLANDPGETHNLAAEKPDALHQLTRKLLDWQKSLPAGSNAGSSTP
jgi:arylsulfatase A-like enzyme